MENKKNFKLLSEQLVAYVDFLKWTSSFGTGALEQVESPLSGVRLKPLVADLFGFARDNIGWMITMDEREAPWLEHLPFEAMFLGYNDGIVIVTKATTINAEQIAPVSLDLFVPKHELLDALKTETLFGFALQRKTGAIERVNRIIPIYRKDSFDDIAAQRKHAGSRDLFAN